MTTVLMPGEAPPSAVEQVRSGHVFLYRAIHSKTFMAGSALTVVPRIRGGPCPCPQPVRSKSPGSV